MFIFTVLLFLFSLVFVFSHCHVGLPHERLVCLSLSLSLIFWKAESDVCDGHSCLSSDVTLSSLSILRRPILLALIVSVEESLPGGIHLSCFMLGFLLYCVSWPKPYCDWIFVPPVLYFLNWERQMYCPMQEKFSRIFRPLVIRPCPLLISSFSNLFILCLSMS